MVAVKNINLDKMTNAFIEELSSKGGQPLYKLSPADARKVLESVQAMKVEKPAVSIEDQKIPVGPNGEVSIRIVRPKNVKGVLPIILYVHGGGWVLGSADTHDRLISELAVGAEAALVFINYSRSPEAKFPIAIEEAYAAMEYVVKQGRSINMDPTRLAVVGDSVGGNMAIALTMMANERHGAKINFQALFYPVTNADMNTGSYHEFADGPWLTKPAMEWFWNAYEPNVAARKKPLMSPLHASLDQLRGLPPALIITDENDVLRDEGEEYAHRLMQAGVDVTAVRVLGTVHDFMMLNPIAQTPAVRGAIALAIAYLKRAFEI